MIKVVRRKVSKKKVRKKQTVQKKGGLVCPECGSTEFIEDPVRGELVCVKCGLVLEEMLEDILRRAIELIGEDLESALKKGESTKELEDAKRAVERILESRKILQRLIDNIRKDVRQIP